MSPVFTLAALLIGVLAVGLALVGGRRDRPNWTAISILVGIGAILIATAMFALIVVFALDGTSG
jgi:hypothetical protein